MKRIIALFISICIIICLYLPIVSAKAGRSTELFKSKVSEDLIKAISTMDDKDIITAYVFVEDIDHKAVMTAFKENYSKEYKTYISAKNSQDFSSEDIVYDADISIKDVFDHRESLDSEEYTTLLQKAIEAKRNLYREAYYRNNKKIISRCCDIDKDCIFISEYTPMTIVKVNISIIEKMLTDDGIIWIDVLIDDKGEDTLSLANQITRTEYVRDTYGNKGNGVKIGQIESGVPDKTNTDLTSVAITINPNANTVTTHATDVARIMVGQANGIAPKASLYSTGYSSASSFYPNVEWLLSKGVNVINMSNAIVYNGTYDNYCKWVDHIAIQHDVHFVSSAGNQYKSYGGKICSPGMAYNVITVGAFDDGNTLAHANDAMCNYSSFQEVASSGRPEKPNLVAPGQNIYISSNHNGTSFSSPQVTGTIAQLCSYSTNLKTKQSIMGAILAASSARKVEGTNGTGNSGDTFISSSRINEQISEYEGAGKLDSRWARSIVYYGNYWSASIDQSSFPYTKTVTINTSSTSLTRIAIFWLKRNSISTTGHIPGTISGETFTNLNLAVYAPNGTQISSSTLYSNYEIVQFVPTVSGQYTIKITRSGTSTSTREVVGISMW